MEIGGNDYRAWPHTNLIDTLIKTQQHAIDERSRRIDHSLPLRGSH
jgi:hypothetical protein